MWLPATPEIKQSSGEMTQKTVGRTMRMNRNGKFQEQTGNNIILLKRQRRASLGTSVSQGTSAELRWSVLNRIYFRHNQSFVILLKLVLYT